MTKRFLLTAALILLGSCGMWAGSICPAASGAHPVPHPPDPSGTGCNVVITINADQSVTVTVTDPAPYEDSEDILVGVQNNSSKPVGSLSLTGTGIFGFDADGICGFTFVGDSYCTPAQVLGTDPQNYNGPTSTFAVSDVNTGGVFFSPAIAPGSSAYFSLDGDPSSPLSAAIGSNGVPALSAWGLVGLSALLMGLSLWMLRRAA
jgi:hypothetical protein